MKNENVFGLTEHKIRNIVGDATYRFNMDEYVNLIKDCYFQWGDHKKRLEENDFIKNCFRKQTWYVLRNGHTNYDLWKQFFEKKLRIDFRGRLVDRRDLYDKTWKYMQTVIRDSFNSLYPEIYERFCNDKD